MRICFATNNQFKVNEIRSLLPEDIELISLLDIGCVEELPETQNTLEGNSHQKAEYVYKKYGIPCFADDTGLEVFALDGEPGVYSARYAGEHRGNADNIQLLLDKLSGSEDRKAQFRTVITFINEHGKVKQFEGMVKGEILDELKGTDGFGYDPVFLPKGKSKTFAEMSLEQKNEISHRAVAISKLVAYLIKHYQEEH
ncbi:RdgB/HAM1 family non-canonical purine NTP pyrophosphatase [Fulvivirga sp. M361]|uniref:RdgB/HAM1 family non-canonical purine NTP pyrophosphatase n=1 Tax=Fulvivirga sp. M361 TaxID=2594266 RepID=UPI00117A01AB|nr:RdgB/HAM1 family non-canonical purine NTP pyrophosphatase [Fulvivirga sp. M361]TRX61262.1 RdgB/HAM1 family non-canonical purine NTP pyrophosphatase [Fulvivirga sp. M361]